MEISQRNKKIMEVRRRTMASIQGCRQALESSGWSVDSACLTIAKTMHEERYGDGSHDAYGIICPYIHAFGRIGVMVELSCESSFVAKHMEFVKLANIIAVHIAWSNPQGIDRCDVNSAFDEVCLLDQPEMKETQGQRTIRELISELSMKTGEKIGIARFSRFEVGKPSICLSASLVVPDISL